ncbi:MAG: primosomal protein N' [Planctomycetota bacterium]|nr:MAG: primosomal protein N' [Planctomycetota bacterium]
MPPAPQADGLGYARVALDTPVRREFSYLVPPEMQAVEAGCRVRVPFGSRRLVGVVVGLDPHPPAGIPRDKLRPLGALLDERPLLTPALIRLARHIADSTYCSWGNALGAMLPAALRRARPRRSVPVVALARPLSPQEQSELAQRFPKQERAAAYLEAAGGPMELAQFQARTGLSRSPLQSLARRGVVRFARRQELSDPFRDAPVRPDRPPELSGEQVAAVAEILAALEAGRHAGFLLFGVTGSGKTEVYLRALRRCLDLGRGAIILVPEIALTPQTVARFRARVGDVAVLHSGLTDAERHDQWTAIAQGRLHVVVGARSALFAPLPRLGLVVVDEEHESSFKQEQTPRYHAREVALERARLEGAVCVLGSATPSLESWQAARDGRLRRLDLPRRVAGGRMPEVALVDMRVQKPEQGHWTVVSEPLRQALERALERRERAILFLNQRGFAPAWHCRACGGSVHCRRCDVALTYHRWRRRALCHYCLQEFPPPERCPECGQPVQLVGVGTERAEDALARLFPRARIARMDRDTMLRRESYEKVLEDFGAGRVDFLLGTQMVAKGLDFPEVTVVGVLNADTALHHPDFRAAERCFNLVAQVSGRAGRSARGGQVVVQTWRPEHPALQAAVHHDYPAFAGHELEERRAFGYPPFARVVRIVCEAGVTAKADQLAAGAAAALRALPAPGCSLLGPAPPPVERLRGRWRRQILLKAVPPPALAPLQGVLYELCQRPGVTVDPL